MAQFKGIYPAPPLTTAPAGLFSVADVWTHSRAGYDEKWVRGFSHEFESRPTLRIIGSVDYTPTDGVLATGPAVNWEEVDSFGIEVEDHHSAIDLLGDGRFPRVLRQLEAATQKAVERELWEGIAAQGDANNNRYLTKTGASVEVGAGGVAPDKALFLIEQSISNSPTGQAGVLHMTRDVASALGSRLLWRDGKIITRLGTEVVVGSGYTGSGPNGDADVAASDTNKWIFATGALTVHLTKGRVVNEDYARSVKSDDNDVFIVAQREAAVYFDPSIHYTVQVTLP